MRQLFELFVNYFTWYSKQSRKYKEIKADETKRQTSIGFGVQALLFILIGVPLSLAVVFGGFIMLGSGNILLVILGVILAVTGVISIFVCVPYALTSAILQMRMNRKIIGVLSLILCFAVLIGGVLFMAYVFNLLAVKA